MKRVFKIIGITILSIIGILLIGLIEAPQKAFFTFEKSAHGTIIEEPEKFVQIILEIALKNTENEINDTKNNANQGFKSIFEVRRTCTWITSSKRSATRGKTNALPQPELRRSSIIDEKCVELLRSSRRYIQFLSSPNCASLVRGYPS